MIYIYIYICGVGRGGGWGDGIEYREYIIQLLHFKIIYLIKSY